MSSKTVGYIQQMDDGEDTFDVKTPFRKFSNWLTRNKVINQLDFFSHHVKFLIDGEDSFKTVFAGIMSIFMYLSVGLITYYVAWPSAFTSVIVETQLNKNPLEIGQSIYENNDNPINLDFYNQAIPGPNGSLNKTYPPQFAVKFYEVRSTGRHKSLPSSHDCLDGAYTCLKSDKGGQAEIFGGIDDGTRWSKIRAEVLWCDINVDPSCPDITYYGFNITLKNVLQVKQLNLKPFYQSYEHSFQEFVYGDYVYFFNVSRQSYTSNTKFLGHLSNILPQTLNTYNYDPTIASNLGNGLGKTISSVSGNQKVICAIEFLPSNTIEEYNEIFVDAGGAIVFFLALIDPVLFIVNFIFVKWYNLNSRNLYIANKLFYMEDTDKHEKYDFNSGPAVFFTCLLYRHILMGLFSKAISLFGRNLADVLPKKCIYTMAMINKGESMLHQNNFFGTLEELSTLEDCPAKKIPFVAPLEDQQEQEVQEIEYFPESAVKRQAFKRFCKLNEFYSALRKNNIYEILRDSKYTTNLKDILHNQFSIEVRNVMKLREKGMIAITMEDGDEEMGGKKKREIPVHLASENRYSDQDSAVNMKSSIVNFMAK